MGVGASPSSASVRERAARVAAPAVGELSALLLTSVSVMLRADSPRAPAPPVPSPDTSAARKSRRGTDRAPPPPPPPPKAIGCELNSLGGVAADRSPA